MSEGNSSAAHDVFLSAWLTLLQFDGIQRAAQLKCQSVVVVVVVFLPACVFVSMSHIDLAPPTDGINIERLTKRNLAAVPITTLLRLIYWIK